MSDKGAAPSSEYSQETDSAFHLLAVDPGRNKCGLCIADKKGALLWRCVAPREQLLETVAPIILQWNIRQLVVGDSTASAEICAGLQERWPHIALKVVDETGSTLEARSLYWQQKPPRGWRRIVPLSLQTPPEPIDDFAALVLARRFLLKR